MRGKLRRIMGAAMEVLQTVLPATAAAAGTTTFEIGEVPAHETQATFTAERITVTSPSLVTGVATNTGTLTVRHLRAGAVITAVVGSLALLVGTNLPAETPVVIPITSVPPLQAGDVLDVQYVQIGTGLALPAGVKVQVEID